MDNGITVNVFDLNTGLTTYKNCEYIRINSKDYKLLIMLDHEPIIGEIEGSVDIKDGNKEFSIKDIKASFMNAKNVFNLMIQGDINGNN